MLLHRGYRVEVLAWMITDHLSGAPNPVLETFRSHGIPVHALRARGRFQVLQRAVQVAVRARQGHFAVVVGHELAGGVVALLAKMLLGGRLRVIAEVHNESAIHSATGTSPGMLRLARILYRRADGIRAVSATIRDDAAAFLRLPRERVTAIHNAFDLGGIRRAAALDPVPDSAPAAPFVVGCGRLVPMKGFPDLIRGFALARRRVRASLVILGDGPEREALVRCAAEAGIADDVVLPGFTPNPFAWFRRAAAFALSSRYGEAFSRVLVEAMACGTPVIASRCRWGPEEVLDGGRYGLMYDVGDVEALAVSMARLIEEPAERARLVRLGKARVEDFAADAIVPRLEALYAGDVSSSPDEGEPLNVAGDAGP
jgi:glycosyltransferase involved in cell wall biosynthesis